MKEKEAFEILEEMVKYRPINSKEMKKELEAINILLYCYKKYKTDKNCINADNSCRQEKLTCKGCYHNEKQKIIEIYYTPMKNGNYDIDCERVVDNDVSNALMKRILHCLLNDSF